MIDWLYTSTLEISLVLLLVLIIRNPIRRIFGAHVAYWLWALPFLKLLVPNPIPRPTVIIQYIKLPNTQDVFPVFSSPFSVGNEQIQIIFWLWISGIFLLSTIRAVNTLKFNQLIELSSFDSSKYWKDVIVRYSVLIEGPIIHGLWKPIIYLPQDFEERYNPTQQRLILEHEYTHYKRLDLWAQLLFEVLRTIYWFNPLIHLATSKFKEDQELSCDYHVLKHANTEDRKAYGKALKHNLSAVLTPNTLTFFYHKHERFIMLSKHKSNKLLTISGLLFGIVAAYPVFTQTPLSLAEKTVETHGTIISYEFNDIPLQTVALLISETIEDLNDIKGLELLQGINVTAKADQIHAFEFLDALLKEHGLKVKMDTNSWEFSKI